MNIAFANEGATAGVVTEEDVQEKDFHHLCLNYYKTMSVPIFIYHIRAVKIEIDTGTAVSCTNRETFD